MKNISWSWAALAGLAFSATLAAAPALAETMAFKAALSGAEEVPPATGKGVGAAVITYDGAAKKLSCKGTYSGLTGNATAAHFHGPAEKGKIAGVEVPVPVPASPFEGSATLTDSQAADLMAGKMYLNIHTAAHPDGEIRGQVSNAE